MCQEFEFPSSKAEVSYFDIPVFVSEDVVWFQVPMNDARLVDSYHTIHQLREDFEVFLSAHFGPPLLDIFLKGLSGAILCLDHQIQGYVWLLFLHKIVNSIDRSVSKGLNNRGRLVFEVFEEHQLSIGMFRFLFILIVAFFRFIQIIALQGESG